MATYSNINMSLCSCPSENPNLFVLALCGVFIALALLLFLAIVLRTWRSWCATDLRLPKSLVLYTS